MLVSSCSAHPNLPTCFCCTDPQLAQPLQLGELLSSHWLASPIGTPLFRSFNPLSLPLASQVGFKLRKHSEHIEESFASGVTGIDRLFDCLEVYTPLLQIVDDVLQITKGTSEPINTGYDQGVTAPDELKSSFELLSGLPSGSTGLFFEDLVATGTFQCGYLKLAILVGG